MTKHDGARLFFDAVAGLYDRSYAPSREESKARMARVLGALPPRGRILDLGVGTGRELPALLDAGHAVTGLDVSPEMLARCGRRSRQIPLVLGDLWEALPFGAGDFDGVVALHGTLAHPPSREALDVLAREVSRVLSPRGVFVMEVPLPRFLDAGGPALCRVAPASGGEGRAVFTDPAIGATIEVWLFERPVWDRVLATHFALSMAAEEGDELFLVAAKRGDPDGA